MAALVGKSTDTIPSMPSRRTVPEPVIPRPRSPGALPACGRMSQRYTQALVKEPQQ